MRRLWLRGVAVAVLASALGLGVGIGAAQIIARAARERAATALRATARDLSACERDPATWAAPGEPPTFAYDGDTFVSASALAPPFTGSETLRIGETHVRSAVTPFGPITVSMRASAHGPCAVLQRQWPRSAPASDVWTIGMSAIALGVAGSVMIALVLLVLPLLRAVRRVARAALDVGRDGVYMPPRDLEPPELARIVETLTASHERVVAQDARERAHRQALERHLSQVAHDLRTPLTSLQLSIEEALDHDCDDAVRRALSRALEESVYLAGLTENLRLAARHRETGRFGGEPTPVDVRDVVERVATRIAVLARRKGMRFLVRLESGSVVARCAPLGVERAISNIVENAVVHGASGGTVEVRLARDGGCFTLHVDDDGPGIDPPTSTSRTGSGLGMEITRDVAADAGWELRVESRDPCGTRVTLEGKLYLDDETGGPSGA